MERLVLVYLARCADSKHQCWPSTYTVAEVCDISRTSVYRAINRLEALNLMCVEPRKRPDGSHSSPVYTLHHGTRGSAMATHKNVVVVPGQSCGGTSILESSSESSMNLKIASEKSDATLPEVGHVSDEELPSTLEHSKFEIQVTGTKLTAEMKAMKITGIAFESQAELETYGPALGVPVKSDDIVKALTKTLTLPMALEKCGSAEVTPKPTKLRQLWKDLHAIYNPGIFCPDMTQKQMGQLKMACDKIEAGGSYAVLIIATAFKDWGSFGKFVKSQTGYDFPTLQDIGFFLKHVNLAVHFCATAPGSGGAGDDADLIKPFVIGKY